MNFPSTVTVPGTVTAPVAGVTVKLNSVTSLAIGNSSLFFTQVVLVSPKGNALVFLGGLGIGTDAVTNCPMTFADGNPSAPFLAPDGTDQHGALPSANGCGGGVTYEATDILNNEGQGGVTPILPGTSVTLTKNNWPQPDASATFASAFGGATTAGGWSLYLADWGGSAVTISGWTLTITLAAGTTTTTVVSGSPDPVTPGNNATYTATVNYGSNASTPTGTVLFTVNGNNLGCNQGNPVTPVISGATGTAHCTVTTTAATNANCNQSTAASGYPKFPSVCQGGHNLITAAYSGDSNYSGSTSPGFTQWVAPASTNLTQPGSTEWCNTTPMYVGLDATEDAYPSYIPVSASGTLLGVSVQLNQISSQDGVAGQYLLVSPDGAHNLDFADEAFEIGTATPSMTLNFADGGTSPATGTPVNNGTYEAFINPGHNDAFVGATGLPSSIPQVPTSQSPSKPINYSASGGLATAFANAFSGATTNGNWALYVTNFNGTELTQISGGWCLTLNIAAPPTITTNPASATFTVGQFGATTMTATGNPSSITWSETPALPTGVTLSSAGVLSGTPAAGTGGQYTLDVTASNGISPNGTQTFTLNVDQAPAITTTPPSTTFTAGTNGSYQMTASGFPAPAFSVPPGSLPAGVTLSSSGLLSGTPNPGTGGTYNFTVTASNGVGTAATQAFTLTVLAPTTTTARSTTTIFSSATQSVTLSATVAVSGSTVNSGTVTFTVLQGATVIGVATTSSPVAGGAASVNYALPPSTANGTYSIHAAFNVGGTTYDTSSDNTQTLTVSGQSVWVVNGGGGTAELAGNGAAISSSAFAGANAAVAIDATGNVWTVGTGATLLEVTSQTGVVQSTSTGGGLSAPTAIAIDGSSQSWIANGGNNSVSLFLDNGAASSPSTGFTDSSLSTPSGIAVDLGGSVWVSNQGNNSVTRILGAAAPAAPLSTAAANNTTGSKP